MARRTGSLVERSEEMLIVAYALSRLSSAHAGKSDRPPEWLGADSWQDAYDLFYGQLGDGRSQTSFRYSLKNARDKFDPYLPSSRRGWLTPEGTPPVPAGWVKRLLEEWGGRSDEELRKAVERILRSAPSRDIVTASEQWLRIRARIERTTRQTVGQSGKIQKRILKNKELRCANLEAALDELMRRQGYRCAQTGVTFVESDPELRASLDRIDSDGHYEDGTLGDGVHNLQLVTHWYNMAKGVRSDREMHRLLELHCREQDTGRDSSIGLPARP